MLEDLRKQIEKLIARYEAEKAENKTKPEAYRCIHRRRRPHRGERKNRYIAPGDQ